MRSISGMITDTLWNQGIIQEEDIDKCRYGLDMFISSALEVASILVIAAVIIKLIALPKCKYPLGVGARREMKDKAGLACI